MNFSHLDWPSVLVTATLSSLGVIGSMAIKRWIDRSLEERKVHWERASWVHQRQIEALTKLFVELNRMKDLLQGATRGFKSQGEMSQEGYFEKWQLKAAEAWSEYIEHKLLLNEAIVASIEELFGKFNEAGIAIRSAPIFREGEMRKEAAAEEIKAKEIAHKLIPPLLRSIESEARRIIHEESH
ncbi:MAG: hypothetical protein WCF30_02175 [Terracidiphilus sp.]